MDHPMTGSRDTTAMTAMTESAVGQDPEIQRLMGLLGNEIEKLENTISLIGPTLNSVMSAEAPEVDSPQIASDPPNCSHGVEIHEHTMRIRRLRGSLDSIHSRLCI